MMRKQWCSRTQLVTFATAATVYATVAALTGITGRADGGGSGNAGQFLLTGHRPTTPSNIGSFVRDNKAAIVLGKALFWDMQAGSDGRQACASCHYAAGADNRTANSLNPGHDGAFSAGHGPNYVSGAGDFPFHVLANVNSNTSSVISDTDDVYGSQGVYLRDFISTGSLPVDSCTDVPDATFSIAGINTRRVTGRQAPTNINAAFNLRNFWDGRAFDQFNGANPSGQNDPSARIYRNVSGVLTPVQIAIPNSSAASQSTGPAMSGTEMSCGGRIWPNLGHKLLGLVPLASQHVSAKDSVLGPYTNSNGIGLNTSYAALIEQAFQPDLWNGAGTVTIGGGSYSQMEANFSLYWGLAIQAYESTLISDNAPIDQFALGNTSALTAQQQQGLNLFTGQGRCSQCHSGPTFSEATKNSDRAFANDAVRASVEDGGDVVLGGGRFKVPTLRNVELTGPYMHNGGLGTLRQVVDFYNRGGDFPEKGLTDDNVRALGLSSTQKDALVAFMVALTDERVRWQKAPFDHPELCLNMAPQGDMTQVQANNGSIEAIDVVSCLPAVGATGASTPLKTFLGLSPYQQ